MSIRQALLAILDQAPCYGSQLRTEYHRRTGSTWPLNVGQIYTTLDRLERDGLIRAGERDAQGHLYYEISDAGRREVVAWFALPLERSATHRDDLAAKVSIAVTLPGVDAGVVIEAQREFVEARLAELVERRDRAIAPRMRVDAAPSKRDGMRLPPDERAGASALLAGELILEALIGSAESELRWLDLAGARVRAAGRAAEGMQLDTNAPRRGRPRTVAPANG